MSWLFLTRLEFINSDLDYQINNKISEIKTAYIVQLSFWDSSYLNLSNYFSFCKSEMVKHIP